MTRTTIATIAGAIIALLVAGWGVAAMWRDMGVTLSLHGCTKVVDVLCDRIGRDLRLVER